MTGNHSTAKDAPAVEEDRALETAAETEMATGAGAAGSLIPVIHDIEPAPALAKATPKAVAMAGKADIAVPQTQSLDLAFEVLDYLTDPARSAPSTRS